MSRIGKRPIDIPEKVQVTLKGSEVSIKGPNGELHREFNNLVRIEGRESKIFVEPVDSTRKARALWGLTRTLIENMVIGVTSGFTRELEFNGVGYKAAVSGDSMTLNLGYSHPIEYKLPQGVSAKVNKNVIELKSSNKELLGFVASKIRSFRPPEPYKGKGVKYKEEVIVRKAGKTGAKK